MWGWIIAAVLLTAIIILPVVVTADYNAQGTRVFLCVGLIRFCLYPRKSGSNDKKTKKKMSDGSTSKAPKTKQYSGGKLTEFLPILQSLLAFLGELRRRIIVRVLNVKIILAGGDPCDLSINYGRTWAAVGNLQPQLDRLFIIEKQNIDVGCDYVSDETTVICHAAVSISLGRLLVLVTRYGLRVFKQYFTIKNQSKGGTGYEPESSSNA